MNRREESMESHIPAAVWLSMVFPFLLFAGQVDNVYAEAKNIIYQAMWQGDNIGGDLYVNGFFITGFAGFPSAGGLPLNPLLIGKNKIWAKVGKADLSKPAYLSFGVSKLSKGEIASTSDRENLVSVEIRDDFFKEAAVMTMGREFESSIDFGRTLSGTERASEKEVIEYAKYIYDLFKTRNASGIQKEFKIKISDYSKAYPDANVTAEFESYLKKELLVGRLEKINLNHLKAKQTGPDDKLWQVFEGNKEFIRITSRDGSLNEMNLYIGKVDGKLQVVR